MATGIPLRKWCDMMKVCRNRYCRSTPVPNTSTMNDTIVSTSENRGCVVGCFRRPPSRNNRCCNCGFWIRYGVYKQKYLYCQSQYFKTWESKCLVAFTQMPPLISLGFEKKSNTFSWINHFDPNSLSLDLGVKLTIKQSINDDKVHQRTYAPPDLNVLKANNSAPAYILFHKWYFV